jgi:Sec-independent protein secretion pathway component TatC
MSKKIVGYSVGAMIALFIWTPWIVPDSWAYIRKAESEYFPMWHTLAVISCYLLFLFAFAGIVWTVDSINNFISKPSTKEE